MCFQNTWDMKAIMHNQQQEQRRASKSKARDSWVTARCKEPSRAQIPRRKTKSIHSEVNKCQATTPAQRSV